jgi:signal transduction histidine kinase
MARLLRSTWARLAIGYAAFFAFSSLFLIGFLWWRTAILLDRRNDADISAASRQITEALHDFGVNGAIASIKDRSAAPGADRNILLLADAGLKRLAGNLSAWPPDATAAGWRWTKLPRVGAPHEVRLLHTEISGGLHLLVGRDVEDRAEIRSLIAEALGWAFVSTLILATSGGLLLRRAVLRRVESLNDAAAAITRGELDRRVPTRGTSDAFDQLAQTINIMLQQIQQLIESVRNTSNAVAHDLRTPLAELRARLEELTLVRPCADTAFEEIQTAVADIDRVIAVFNALLRLAEIDSGLRRSGFRRVELSSVVTEVAEFYAPLIDEKKTSFLVDAPDEFTVNGDPHLIAQAVGNLVDNAVKFTPCQGTISLRIAKADDRSVGVVVADSGPGIPPDEKSRVTQRFHRTAAGKIQPGIGLGLSVVEAVARLHEGRLVLTDNKPGLRAELIFPAARD